MEQKSVKQAEVVLLLSHFICGVITLLTFEEMIRL